MMLTQFVKSKNSERSIALLQEAAQINSSAIEQAGIAVPVILQCLFLTISMRILRYSYYPELLYYRHKKMLLPVIHHKNLIFCN
jgi:hypothetical protein